MTETERLAELRELFMSAPEAVSTRVVALVASVLLDLTKCFIGQPSEQSPEEGARCASSPHTHVGRRVRSAAALSDRLGGRG